MKKFLLLVGLVVIVAIAGKFWIEGFISKKEEQIVKNKYDYELEIKIPYSDFFTQKINSDIDEAITDILNNNYGNSNTLGDLVIDSTIDKLFDDNEVVEVEINKIHFLKKVFPTNHSDDKSSYFEYYLKKPKFTYYFVENLEPIKKNIKNLTIDENQGKISFQLNDFYIRKIYSYYDSLLYKSVKSNLKHLGVKSFYISQLEDNYRVFFSSKDIDNSDIDFALDSIPEKLTCHTFDKTHGCKKEYSLEIHKVLPKKVGQAKAFGLDYNEKIVSLNKDPFLIDTNKVCIDYEYSDYRRVPEYWRNNIFSQLFFSKTAFAGDVHFLKDKICIFNGLVKVKAPHKANSWTKLGDHFIQDIPMGHISIDEEVWQLIKEDCFGGKKYLERFKKEYDEKLEMVKNSQGNINRNVVGEYWKHNCYGKYLITLDNLVPIAYFKVAEPYGEEEKWDILDPQPSRNPSRFTKLYIENINEKIFENNVNTFSLPYYEVDLKKTTDKSFTNYLRALISKEKEYDEYMRAFGGDKLKLINYYIRVLLS